MRKEINLDLISFSTALSSAHVGTGRWPTFVCFFLFDGFALFFLIFTRFAIVFNHFRIVTFFIDDVFFVFILKIIDL